MFTPAPLPIPIVSYLISLFIDMLILAMLVRAIASWMRFGEGNGFIRFLARLTDPFIEPARRVIGQIGVIDLSFFFAWFLLITLQHLILQSLPVGW